tara:strand:+ start:1983 stop:2354 length:372 start_codon:yes stop_codon:yes gene_type:complete
MLKQKRWALLEHIGSPDDPSGRHFDLLLEERNACRTWRLEQIPVLDGSSQEILSLPNHRLSWLEISFCEISRGRGWARKVCGGYFYDQLPSNKSDPIQIELCINGINGILEIKKLLCRFFSVP